METINKDLAKEATKQTNGHADTEKGSKVAARTLPTKPTASQRLEKLENFAVLKEKYEYLTTKRKDLETAQAANDGSRVKLTFKNGYRDVEITNQEVIKKAFEVTFPTLDKLIQETEKEIENYTI